MPFSQSQIIIASRSKQKKLLCMSVASEWIQILYACPVCHTLVSLWWNCFRTTVAAIVMCGISLKVTDYQSDPQRTMKKAYARHMPCCWLPDSPNERELITIYYYYCLCVLWRVVQICAECIEARKRQLEACLGTRCIHEFQKHRSQSWKVPDRQLAAVLRPDELSRPRINRVNAHFRPRKKLFQQLAAATQGHSAYWSRGSSGSAASYNDIKHRRIDCSCDRRDRCGAKRRQLRWWISHSVADAGQSRWKPNLHRSTLQSGAGRECING